MIHAFEAVAGKEIPHSVCPRRAGDIATCYADTSLAKEELGFEAVRDLKKMCEDAYRWQTANPRGYR